MGKIPGSKSAEQVDAAVVKGVKRTQCRWCEFRRGERCRGEAARQIAKGKKKKRFGFLSLEMALSTKFKDGKMAVERLRLS